MDPCIIAVILSNSWWCLDPYCTRGDQYHQYGALSYLRRGRDYEARHFIAWAEGAHVVIEAYVTLHMPQNVTYFTW